MKNLKLTKWLEMVGKALAEHDRMKRDQLLHAADLFLRTHQEPDAELTLRIIKKTAA
jgi:hypothetical protein